MEVRGILLTALRGMRVARGNLAVAFCILTVAMAAGTVTFSVVDAVAIKPLPYASPNQLVSIAAPVDRPGRIGAMLQSDFFLLKQRTQAFAGLAASRPVASLQFGDAGAAPLPTRAVTLDLFEVLGVRPSLGRLFGSGDDRSTPRLAVLSHEFWTDRFAADRSIIGRTVTFGREPLQVIGVLPAGVWYPMEMNPPAVYVPYAPTAEDIVNTRTRAMSVVGRLRDDMPVSQARADVVRVITSPVVVQPLADQVIGSARSWLLLLLAAVALVVAIACVNVATLLLSRATTRAREFAIRAALGESRRELIAGVLIEGIVVALAAAIAGVALSVWGVDAAKAALPANLLTRVSTIAVDGRVVLAATSVALLCAAAFGAAPAWLATRFNLFAVIGSAGGPIVGGRRIDRSLAAFLVTEVSVVCVLLVAATLVVRSFIAITTTDLGFDRKGIAQVAFMKPAASANDAALRIDGTTLRSELLRVARSVPGVTDAAIAVNGPVPLASASIKYSIVVPGYGETLNTDLLEMRIVSPEYFSVMGMQLVSGRLLDARDQFGSPRSIVINEEAAARFFQGRNPVGQVVTFHGSTEIVGVLRSVRFDGPEGVIRPEMYVTADQEPLPLQQHFGYVIVRTNGSPEEAGQAVRDAMRPVLGVDAGPIQLVDEMFASLTAGRRFNASVMAVFGLIAVVLGMAGVYSTMQFLVTRQFKDIGLRLALGATRARIMRAVLTTAFMRVAVGLAIGLALTWSVSSTFRAFVFGVTTTEPGVYAAVAGFIVAFGIAAAAFPALRASRLDPVETLRRE